MFSFPDVFKPEAGSTLFQRLAGFLANDALLVCVCGLIDAIVGQVPCVWLVAFTRGPACVWLRFAL